MPLPFRRAAIGSTDPAKIEAVRLVLARLAPDCALQAKVVPSGVAAQPVGDQGGVLEEPSLVWLVSWVAAVARDGRHGDASGLRLPLPSAVGGRLAAGDQLGTIMDDLFRVTASKQQSGAVGLLMEGFVSRTDAFADLVAMACVPLLRPDLYPLGGNT